MITKQWFKDNQALLLWMANTEYGRDLLDINKDYPSVISFQPNHLKCQIRKNRFLYDFRIGNKWANVIARRWKEFKFLSQYFNKEVPIISYSRIYDSIQIAATTYDPFVPDASSPGTATWDGLLFRNNTEGWTTIVAGAGTGVLHAADSPGEIVRIDAPNGTEWNVLGRGHFGFDTSVIADSETVDIATLSFYGTSKLNPAGWSNTDFGVSIVNHTPSSNIIGVASDYNVATYGSTKYANDISYSDWSVTSYNDFPLNGSGKTHVSKTGITNFGTRVPADIANSLTHTGVSGSNLIAANYSNGTNDPKLVVITDVAVGSVSGVIRRHDIKFSLGVDERGTSYTFPLLRMEADHDFYIEDFIPIFTNHGSGDITFNIKNQDKSNVDYPISLDGDNDPGGIGIDYTEDEFNDIIYTNSDTAQQTRKEIKPMCGSSRTKEISFTCDDDNFPFSLTDIYLKVFEHW